MNLENLKFQSHENLGIVQFRTPSINTFDYISFSQALKHRNLKITEVDEFGRVNDLLVTNDSKNFIFMSDGDILIGAKQNRVLNTSVLLKPKSKIRIPVSCVEQGRWRYAKREFAESDFYAPSFMRAAKASDVKLNLQKKKLFYAEQGKVWENVNDYETNFGERSESNDLGHIFESQRIRFDHQSKSLRPEKHSNGIAMFSGGRLLSIEVFNRSDVFAEYFPKIIRGTLFEIFSMKDYERQDTRAAEALYKTQDFFDNFDNSVYMDGFNFEEHRGVGVGKERRFETTHMTGFELEYESKQIHLVALNTRRRIFS